MCLLWKHKSQATGKCAVVRSYFGANPQPQECSRWDNPEHPSRLGQAGDPRSCPQSQLSSPESCYHCFPHHGQRVWESPHLQRCYISKAGREKSILCTAKAKTPQNKTRCLFSLPKVEWVPGHQLAKEGKSTHHLAMISHFIKQIRKLKFFMPCPVMMSRLFLC